MNRLFGALRYEWYRLCHCPKLWGSVTVVFVLLIIVGSINYFFIMPTDSMEEHDRESELATIRVEIDEYHTFLDQNGGSFSGRDLRAYRSELSKLEFYWETRTIPSDYANAQFSSRKIAGREGTGSMFYMGTICAFAVWAVSILFGAYLFGYDYSIHFHKNLFASAVGRNGIFYAKLLLHTALCGMAYLIIFAFPFLFGATDEWQMLVYIGDSYRAISTLQVFFAQYVGVGAISILLGACTIGICVWFKRPILAVAVALSIYGVALLFAFAFVNAVYENLTLSILNNTAYMPLLSVQLHVGWFDLPYSIALAIHLFVGAVLLIVAQKQFYNQDP